MRSTGQEFPSALTRFTSSFVPRILNDDFSVSMGPNSGTTALYRFGVGASVVGRSRSNPCAWNDTLALSLSIFLRKNEAMTDVGVW